MKLYNKNELKDSRIFFEKKPPKFLTIFIMFVCVLLITTVLISMYLVKPYIVKAQGIVTTSDNTYQSIQTNGYVVEIVAQEGKLVKKGEVLFKLSNGQEGIQNQALFEQMNYLNSKIAAMDKYEASLNNKQNLMANEGVEQEYYGKVEYYLSQLNDESFNMNSTQTKLNEKINEKSKLENEVASLQTQLKELEGKEEIEEEKTKLEGDIEAKNGEMKALDEEVKQFQEQMNSPSSQAQQIYTQMVSELGTSRSDTEGKLVEIRGQFKVANGQNELLIIKASNDGYIHYLSNLKVGMALQQNQVIAEVSNNQEEHLIVEAYIPANDITKVVVGNDVNVAIMGTNLQKYGTLKGRLVFVDNGTITQESEQGNMVYYKCDISLSKTQLSASDKTTIQVIKSMPIEARIVYDRETYFEWIMELLSFKN